MVDLWVGGHRTTTNNDELGNWCVSGCDGSQSMPSYGLLHDDFEPIDTYSYMVPIYIHMYEKNASMYYERDEYLAPTHPPLVPSESYPSVLVSYIGSTIVV